MLSALAALVGAAVLAGAVWLVGWSDVLTLENVQVDGASGELADRVVEVAEAPLGTPLVRVDTDAVAARVRSLPELASVSVDRAWPRSIVVSVTPRVAVAAVADDGAWWLVDASGALFGNSTAQPADLPVVDVPVAGEAATIRVAAVSVWTGLPAELRELVAGVSAESEADVRLSLTTGASVLWGGPDHGDRKAEVLLSLLDQEASVFDVSAPERPSLVP